jgi:hypothetical protein
VGLFIIQRASVPHTVKKPCSVILGAGRREFKKSSLAYNMKRVMQILGNGGLIEATRA